MVRSIQDISSLTQDDVIDITSTFVTMTNPTYRCSDCVKYKYKHEPERRKKHEQNMLCKETSSSPRHYYKPKYGNKIEYFTCIGNVTSQYWASFITLNEKYQQGQYLMGETYFDQPNKFVELMNLVDNLVVEDQRQKQESLSKVSHGRQSSKR